MPRSGTRPLTTSGMLARVAKPGLSMSRSASDHKGGMQRYGSRVGGGSGIGGTGHSIAGHGGSRNYSNLIRSNGQIGHTRSNREASHCALQAKVAADQMVQCNTGAFVGRASHRHSCGACSVPGVKPSKPYWKNQDSFLLMEKHAGIDGVSLIGVFDGHGPCGGEVSSFCRDNVSWILQDCRVEVCPLMLIVVVVRRVMMSEQKSHPTPPPHHHLTTPPPHALAAVWTSHGPTNLQQLPSSRQRAPPQYQNCAFRLHGRGGSVGTQHDCHLSRR